MLALCCIIFCYNKQGLNSIERGLLFYYLHDGCLAIPLDWIVRRQFPRFFILYNIRNIAKRWGQGD